MEDRPTDQPTRREVQGGNRRRSRSESMVLAARDLMALRDSRDLDSDGKVSAEELAAVSRARVDGYRLISRTVLALAIIAAATWALATGALDQLHIGMDGISVTGRPGVVGE